MSPTLTVIIKGVIGALLQNRGYQVSEAPSARSAGHDNRTPCAV
jgi:hypothetical protein